MPKSKNESQFKEPEGFSTTDGHGLTQIRKKLLSRGATGAAGVQAHNESLKKAPAIFLEAVDAPMKPMLRWSLKESIRKAKRKIERNRSLGLTNKSFLKFLNTQDLTTPIFHGHRK